MDILVVGGTGFVGTHLCRELDERGHDVMAFARHPEDATLPDSVDTVAGDVRAYDAVDDALAGQDAVVHLASLSPLYKPKGGDEMHFEIVVGGTENVVEAAEEHGVEYVLQLSNLGADSNSPTALLRAKGRAEDVVTASDLAYTIFRPSVIFGDGGEFVSFTKLVTTPYVTGLPGGGKARFQPIWIEDVVPMFADALENEEHHGQTYEIGGPEVLTLADVARLAYRAEGKSLRVVPIPMPLVAIGASLVDPLPIIPFGTDQYRSLKADNTTDESGVVAFGRSPSELKTLAEYLGVR